MFAKVGGRARARDRQTFPMRKSILLMYRGLRVWKYPRQPACNTFLTPFQHAFLQVGLPAHRTTIPPAPHMQKPLGSDVPQLFCWGIENPLSRQHGFSQASIVRILLSWHSLPLSVGFWGRACWEITYTRYAPYQPTHGDKRLLHTVLFWNECPVTQLGRAGGHYCSVQ